MRRKDREVLNPELIRAYIHECEICRLGFNDDGEVYIVPLNFGVEETDGQYTLYFHGAKEGRKIDLIRKNPNVGFEMDCHYYVAAGKLGCDCTVRFRSIIGNGKMSIVTDENERMCGIKSIMKQTTGREDWQFSEKMLNATCVFKLEIEKLACKEHL